MGHNPEDRENSEFVYRYKQTKVLGAKLGQTASQLQHLPFMECRQADIPFYGSPESHAVPSPRCSRENSRTVMRAGLNGRSSWMELRVSIISRLVHQQVKVRHHSG